jgi:hypothetical protein
MDNPDTIVEILSLSNSKKILFRQRYLRVLADYKARSTRYTISFYTLRIIVGIGSLLVPALLSIQQIGVGNSDQSDAKKQLDIALFWSTWVLSLLVTMSNGLFTLMKVDKKYYFMHTLLEQLRSEGWQFLTLTGRYAIYRRPDISGGLSHDLAFGLFCHMVEKIKMHQVEEEYYKLTDDYTKQEVNKHTVISSSGSATVTANTNDIKQPLLRKEESITEVTSAAQLPSMMDEPNTDLRMLPKTPQNPLNLDNLPPEMRLQMEALLESSLKEMGVDPNLRKK